MPAAKSITRPAGAAALRRELLAWYGLNKRDLPWRRDRSPYRVWISEIMLQQTRVAAAIGHYRRFLKRFPSLRSLAAARQSDVLAAWSGLGYYHRARRLHQAARLMRTFPRTSAAWRELPGIGRYTAAAIASICFGEPVAVVDGNVERVLARMLGRPPQDAWQTAQALLDPASPGDFNQAMMELGALVCLPQAPRCVECPLRRYCRFRGEHPSGGTPARRRLVVHYSLATRKGAVRLAQRAASSSLMAGMWELPQLSEGGEGPLFRLRHSITNTDYEVLVHAAAGPGKLRTREKWVPLARLGSLPLTGLARKALLRAGLLEA